MNLKEFHALIDEHVVHAKTKHPLFAHMLTHGDAGIYDAQAKHEKRIIQTDVRMNACAATTVISAELYEFFAELASGNLDRAKQEAADLVATIYRALEMLEESRESNKDKRDFYELLEEVKKNRDKQRKE